MDIILLLIIIVAVILAFTYLPGLINNDKEDGFKLPKKANDNEGVEKLVSKMKSFAKINGYKFVGPCSFTKDGTIKTIAGMIVGEFGILAVNAVGKNGEIYGTAADAQWVRITKEGKENFENPFNESALIVRMIRDKLVAAKKNGVFVECVPVFTCKKVQLAVPKSMQAITLKTFGKKISSQKYQENKNVKTDEIAALMQ